MGNAFRRVNTPWESHGRVSRQIHLHTRVHDGVSDSSIILMDLLIDEFCIGVVKITRIGEVTEESGLAAKLREDASAFTRDPVTSRCIVDV